ncbi:hypothetical protein [Solemya elarraichensis gill symbiont]|uniref:hypothetical protein n=1 Tax=Solemya elarraichensis gill symbiont TaxID=1918949 RepID=UPI001083DD36|nr:hypothetical protein [Solemya elarraichensis gill symbiont]
MPLHVVTIKSSIESSSRGEVITTIQNVCLATLQCERGGRLAASCTNKGREFSTADMKPVRRS